jgi:hypothetical protein
MRKPLWIIPSFFLIAAAAHADTFEFSISGGDHGLITITETSGLISAISGKFDGSTINVLLGTGVFGGNDNVYTGTSPYFDNGGVSFSLDTPDDAHGDIFVNLSTASVGAGIFGTCEWNTLAGCNGVVGDGAADTIAQVPEPSSITLTLIVVGVMFAMQKRLGRSSFQAR